MPRNAKKITQRKDLIQDKAKRINLKSKRTRTLIRKAIEVSQMCDLDIHIVLRDREFNKVVEYNSINADGQTFSIEAAKKLIEQFTQIASKKYFRVYTDADYENLKV